MVRQSRHEQPQRFTLTRSVADAAMYAELLVEDGRIVRIDERYLP